LLEKLEQDFGGELPVERRLSRLVDAPSGSLDLVIAAR
jgi:hypothetical protein